MSAMMSRERLFLEELSQEFSCGICTDVLQLPESCQEGHTYCEECIKSWCRTSPTCPACSVFINCARLTRIRIVENLINERRIVCAHSKNGAADSNRKKSTSVSQGSTAVACVEESGCTWQGKYGDLELHLRDDCSFAEVNCVWEGCRVRVERRRLKRHTGHCSFRKLECSHCSIGVPFLEHAAHEDGCPSRVIDCECGAKVLQSRLQNHKDSECPEGIEECKYGCATHIQRKDMERHNADTMKLHLDMLWEKTAAPKLIGKRFRWRCAAPAFPFVRAQWKDAISKTVQVVSQGIRIPVQLSCEISANGEVFGIFVSNMFDMNIDISGTELCLVHPTQSSKSIRRAFPFGDIIEVGSGRGYSKFCDVSRLSDFATEGFLTVTAIIRARHVERAEDAYVDM